MENSIFTQLADNPTLLSALKKLLEDKFSVDSLTSDHADEVLGQMVRARLVGLKAINDAIQDIQKTKTQPTPIPPINRAK